MDKEKNIEKLIWDESGNLLAPEKNKKETAKSFLQDQIKQDASLKLKRNTPIIWYAAASLVFTLLALPFFFNKQYSSSTNVLGNISLPDESVVSLNSKSQVKFNSFLWSLKRKVSLEGEALFQVKKGSKFIVETINGEVQVLGTVFSVFTRENKLIVKCKSGSVRVIDKNYNEVVLKKDQMVKIYGGQTEIAAENFDTNELNWINNKMVCNDLALSEIFSELERHFNVEFIFPSNLSQRKFTGEIPLDDLKKSLFILENAMSFQITHQKAQVIVKEKEI